MMSDLDESASQRPADSGIIEPCLVSIGVPVYNGARYLRKALESLVAQDYQTLEIIISDNASTDDTEAICTEFSENDSRIRYYRSDTNNGACWNFNRLVELANGEYFMWAAFDDLRHPEFVSRCLEELFKNPEAVMCCSQIQYIDEDGEPIEMDPVADWRRPTGLTRSERIGNLARMSAWFDVYGLIRTSALRQTNLFQPVWGGDVVLIAEICLLGPVISTSERLFYYRVFRQKTAVDMGSTLAPAAKPSVAVSYSNMTLDITHAILGCNCGINERLRVAFSFMVYFLVFNLVVRSLVRRDLKSSLITALKSRNAVRFVELLVVTLLVSIPTPLCRLPSRILNRIRGKRGTLVVTQ